MINGKVLERNSGIHSPKHNASWWPLYDKVSSAWSCLSLICLLFPSVAMNHQHQQVVATSLSPQNHPAQNPPTGLMSVPNALTTQQQQQQKLRLQRIQMERERIRMRQEELMRQVWCLLVTLALGGCLVSRQGRRLILTAQFLPTLYAWTIFRADLRSSRTCSHWHGCLAFHW